MRFIERKTGGEADVDGGALKSQFYIVHHVNIAQFAECPGGAN